MKKIILPLVALLLAYTLMMGLSPGLTGYAAFDDLTEHWASDAMTRAHENGLIQGYPGGLMKPDQAMNKAEVLAMLTRLIGAVPPGDLSGTDITADKWYCDTAAQALGLRLLTQEQLSGMEDTITREDAFVLLARAFQLPAPSMPERTLARYHDADDLRYDTRLSVAALLHQGCIEGYNGALSPKNSITRAEFVTILGRLVGQTLAPEELTDDTLGGVNMPPHPSAPTATQPDAETETTPDAGTETSPDASTEADPDADEQADAQVNADAATEAEPPSAPETEAAPETPKEDMLVTVMPPPGADIALTDLHLQTELLINASAKSLALQDVYAQKNVLLRCATLTSLTMSGGELSHLTIAAAAGNVTFAPQDGARVDKLTIGDGSGELHLGDGITQVEITGDNRTVYLDMKALGGVDILGSGNRVIVARDCKVGGLWTYAAGEDNEIVLDGQAESIRLLGDRTKLSGKGKAGEITVRGLDCQISVASDARTEALDYGLSGVSIRLAPTHKILPAGELLSVTASFEGLQEDCIVGAKWYQDGVPSATYRNPTFPLSSEATSEFFPNVPYTEGMALSTTLGLELTYDRSGAIQRVYKETTVLLENYPYEYYHPGPKATDKLIAITFDDGPGRYTEQLLDTLADRGVKATFFLVGRNVTYRPETVARMVEDGHEVGSHTWNHPNLATSGAGTVRSELSSTTEAILDAAGVAPTTMRPPYGSYNQTVRNICAEQGMSVIHWSVDTEDWKSRNGDTIMKRIFNNGGASARDGDIILMHDTVPATVESAGKIIDRLLANGYKFVTVSELIELRYGSSAEPGQVYFYAR